MPGGLPGLPQRRDHHGEVVLQVVGTTVPIPIRRERLDELAEDHQHCRSVHAAIDRDRARLHCLVNYRGELDHSIKRVLALHNATGARDLGSLPTCVHDHEAPHRGVQALIGGNWLAHVDHSNPWRATPGGRSEPGGMVTAPGCGELGRAWVHAERAVADPPAAAESNRRCHQLQQQVDAAATVIAALYASNTALREQLAARTAPVRNLDLFRATRN